MRDTNTNKDNDDRLMSLETNPEIVPVNSIPQHNLLEGGDENGDDIDRDTGGEINEYVETRCGHKYCLKCLETWLKVRNKCAVCGAKCYSIYKSEDDAQAELDERELQEIQNNMA